MLPAQKKETQRRDGVSEMIVFELQRKQDFTIVLYFKQTTDQVTVIKLIHKTSKLQTLFMAGSDGYILVENKFP